MGGGWVHARRRLGPTTYDFSSGGGWVQNLMIFTEEQAGSKNHMILTEEEAGSMHGGGWVPKSYDFSLGGGWVHARRRLGPKSYDFN